MRVLILGWGTLHEAARPHPNPLPEGGAWGRRRESGVEWRAQWTRHRVGKVLLASSRPDLRLSPSPERTCETAAMSGRCRFLGSEIPLEIPFGQRKGARQVRSVAVSFEATEGRQGLAGMFRGWGSLHRFKAQSDSLAAKQPGSPSIRPAGITRQSPTWPPANYGLTTSEAVGAIPNTSIGSSKPMPSKCAAWRRGRRGTRSPSSNRRTARSSSPSRSPEVSHNEDD